MGHRNLIATSFSFHIFAIVTLFHLVLVTLESICQKLFLVSIQILYGGGAILHKPDELPPDSGLLQACKVWSKITGRHD